MTTTEMQKIAAMQQMTKTGSLELPDDQNPVFLFNSTFTDLLSLIATGKIDATQLAKQQLKQRGLNYDGQWIGFEAAANLK